MFSWEADMKARIEDRELARVLRRQGHSYSEIRSRISVAKGTLNGWLKDIELTPEQKQRLLAKEAGSRLLGPWRNREKSLERMRETVELARAEFALKARDPLFLTGVALYWAEGAKTTRAFHFMNSDPGAIRVMIAWRTESADLPKEKIVVRVQVHRVYAQSGFDEFWKTVTGLPDPQFRTPTFKPTPHKIKKNAWYLGCCRLSVYSVVLFWKLKAWQDALLEYLGISGARHPNLRAVQSVLNSPNGE